jgi:hypothetical protein
MTSRTSRKKLKKAWGWEASVVRCANCGKFKKPQTVLLNSLPTYIPPRCKLGDFITKPEACCDKHTQLESEADHG